MPTYDYRCAKCKVTYELREGFSAPTSHRCQECGKGTAKRVLHAPRVVFKGSGWYVTDSRQKSSAVSDAGSGDKSDGAAAGDAKSDGKAAATKAEPAKPSKKDESSAAAAGS